jgi:hypothetical protein
MQSIFSDREIINLEKDFDSFDSTIKPEKPGAVQWIGENRGE